MSKITRALLSVSDKTGLLEFARALHEMKVEILSTGGTAKMLRDAGLPVKDVSEHTGFPEMLDGRVKTLHPKVHGGLLGIRGNAEHEKVMQEHGIGPIDLVVVNLYPFEETVKKGADYDTCIENIDIGGPAMIRSSAKNHADVTVIVEATDYETVIAELKVSGETTLTTRKKLAAKAYARTAAYDAKISQWFAKQQDDLFPERHAFASERKQLLSYGENPHQHAAFYVGCDPCRPSLATARQLQGKELSYNNINDADGAWDLVSEFTGAPAVAIIKHANPCGVATAASLREAYVNALACDPVSAYGGIIAVNKPLDAGTAQEIAKLFVEVVIAPEVSPEARAILNQKQKLRVLETGGMPDPKAMDYVVKSVSGGLLVQTRDNTVFDEAAARVVTRRQPSAQEMEDMRMALTVAKHVKSNAIVLAKGGRTIGIGAGQMSRVDSVKIACEKAAAAKLETKGCALASEAFFPFDDNVHLAAKAGIRSVIQPGGSIRDEEVIKAADEHGMTMVFTGIRHFRH